MVLFFVVLLIVVQLASFFFIRYAIEQTAQNTLREELRVGARVFRRLLEQNGQQLLEATSVLTYDFGFREAIASRDRDTILSALRNHAARIKASGMAVIDLDNVVVADTLVLDHAGKPFEGQALVRRAEAQGRASGVRMIDGRPYQVVVVPVLAPLPIAWVAMHFVIDDNEARDLQRLSSSDVSFVRIGEPGATLLATTLPQPRHEALLREARRVVAGGMQGTQVRLGDELFEALATPLEDSADLRLFAILQRSVADGIAPYLALQAALLVIAGLSIAVTLVGSMRIARRITRPVTSLASAAREIARGNYAVRVDNTSADEIGELARAFNGMAEGLAERDNMRDVLGKVASSEVVKQLLDNAIPLVGEELDVTVMFTDVRNFTALCETLEPRQSLALLNEFLTVISAVVEEHEGVVDKYLGDGVMALFGAPVTREDDAQRAVNAALEIRRRIDRLRPELAGRGMPDPEIGIGLNTSRVVAGTIGSPSRLNYTVLGDGVNLSSRLEGLTKRYHVPVVVGNRTCENVRGVVFRELDKVRVRGRTVPERLIQPLGHEGEVPGAEIVLLERWHEALAAFRARRFDEAREQFQAFARARGYERLVSIYLGYLRALDAQPPDERWDAAFTLYDK